MFISKKQFVLLLFIVLDLSQLNAHVRLMSPEGGETYNAGDNVNINWRNVIDHSTLNWDLLFSNDGGIKWDTIQMDIPVATLNYLWTIPANYTSRGQIKVVQDNPGDNYTDTSGNFTITSITGIDDTNTSFNFKVYPNPLTGSAIVEFENLSGESHTFTLFDMNGRMVMTIADITSDKIAFSRGSLITGLYYFQVRSVQKALFTGKVIIK